MKLRFVALPIILALVLSGCASLSHLKTNQAAAGKIRDSENPFNRRLSSSSSKNPLCDNAADLSSPDCQGYGAQSELSQNNGEGSDSSEDLSTADMDPAEAAAVRAAQQTLDHALELCQVSQDFWQKGELENALDALDQAYGLIIGVETGDHPKLMQQKEDLRFTISKRIMEIYASRNVVVTGNHNPIPIALNKHVQAEINLFTTGPEHSFFMEAYRRSGRYRPQIVQELQEAGLPEELSWLPLIESGYRVNALSRSRALGLWQFIPSTGYKFGLKRDKFIDERMDPEKSTRAAIDYLKELHGIFGDWSTVLAAYNCGEGRVLQVIRNQKINYLDNFWDLYERLPEETARYVPRFLATLQIVKHPEKYGLDAVDVEEPYQYETVTIDKQIHIRDAAKVMATTEEVLKTLNPELRYRILPGEGYPLKVPPQSGGILLASLDQIPVSAPPQPAFVYHRVRSGETLSTIARKYRTNVGSIMRANDLRRSNFIVVGKLLKIPQRGYIYTKAEISKPQPDQAVSHVVRQGDSLWNIAKQYDTTTQKIQELNDLSDSQLYKGQVLTISAAQTAAPQVDGLDVYEVRSGDNPFEIARRHNMTVERLLFLNQLAPNSRIYPGQKLYIE
jgi:membrane-bound lytic murein transglycosylase D